MSSQQAIGRVFLVGAGPGDPDLITMRGMTLLRAADVVLFDRLIAMELLAAAESAELIDVGKAPCAHRRTQADINALIVSYALAGKTVVRLKGGDPLTFGRGMEERDACREHGIDYGFTIFPREPATTFISEDPARCWRDIGEYLLYDATAYGSWRHPNRRAYAESRATTLEELIEEGKYRILTPDQALQVIAETGALHLAPLTGGVPSAIGWSSLRLFEERVQPYLQN